MSLDNALLILEAKEGNKARVRFMGGEQKRCACRLTGSRPY